MNEEKLITDAYKEKCVTVSIIWSRTINNKHSSLLIETYHDGRYIEPQHWTLILHNKIERLRVNSLRATTNGDMPDLYKIRTGEEIRTTTNTCRRSVIV